MSFENSTIESLATSLAKTRPKVLKREAQVVFDSRNDEPDKKQKLGDGSPFTTTPSTGSEAPLTDLQRSFQNPLIEWEEGKSTSSSAEQQKKQGRTRAKPVQTFQPAKPYTYIGIPKFRRDRPVETNIPYEVWKVILSFCPPAFLEKVARVSDPTLHDVLMRHGGDSEKVWKLARLREYGPDHPDPPPDITERKYADL